MGTSAETAVECRLDLTARHEIAWTAYIKPTVFLGGWLLMAWIFKSFGTAFAVAFGAIGVLRYVVAIWWRATAWVEMDEDGVWLVSGVFPWTRGMNGIRWREIGIALYRLGLFSWVFGAFTIHVKNRFDANLGLLVHHVRRGDEFISLVNAVLADRHPN